ncbi:hypothetical protein G210_2669 [Candida maltosa Xu316]|uniref:Zn(2)-C6 fungal-type domain-containing protein n=1 Tax=Candida maltosa (strain Xu316) TaxID=1245528 RepID=M3JXB5_CANMX|nr:hypothetical protein G210_2669 [Candida maltosa Xu316]
MYHPMQIQNQPMTTLDSSTTNTNSTTTSTTTTTVQIIEEGKIVKKVQKTRQRKILSCVYCHSKKIKCNRQEPCSQCTKLEIECKYFINERISRGGKKSSRLTETEKKLRGLQDASSSSITTSTTSTTHQQQQHQHQQPMNGSSSSQSSSPTNSSSTVSNSAPPVTATSSIATSIDDMDQGNGKGLRDDDNDFKHAPSIDMSVNFMALVSKNETSMSQSNSANRVSTPLVDSPMSTDPFAASQLIQSPVINNTTNNMTNNFFNTNFTTNTINNNTTNTNTVNANQILSTNNNSINSENITPNSDNNANNNNNSTTNLISFNSSTFPLANQDSMNGFPSNLSSPMIHNGMPSEFKRDQLDPLSKNQQQQQPQQDQQQQQQQQSQQQQSQHNSNPALYNSLTAYSSNPATTINYLYGTNTYYENSHLFEDLSHHLPTSRERSFELMERYMNSVHLLLPIVVNLKEFMQEHKRYWEIKSKSRLSVSSSPNNPVVESPCDSHQNLSDLDFNYIQFYTLYLPILYASTISEFEEYDNLLLNQDIDKYLKGFNKICQYYNYPHGIKTIPLLLGNVIIQSTSPNPSTMEMAQIIRYAKFLHFHKDPSITLRIKDPEVVKFRRLLWWVIFGLDALSSHNFCLPPNCRIDDFNVLMPDEEEPKLGSNDKQLNLSILSMNIKFGYDRILSELVYHLHNGLSANITQVQINEIKKMIITYRASVQTSIDKINKYFSFKTSGNYNIQDMNLISFVKSHSWSYVDRALMLLHKKILLGTPNFPDEKEYSVPVDHLALEKHNGNLSLSKYEDTFGHILEANIITNFNNSSISLLKYGDFDNFSYDDLNNNLIPSILHNFNDFLQYNDFIKFGKFNWYIKRTIPIDSVIIMMVIISVKFKYKFINSDEFLVYKNLINNVLFIINRKWFKNEKYKRMLSLTNMMWEYLLKKFPAIKESEQDKNIVSTSAIDELQLKEKILYDLRHNFIDINDYCSFYSSLENLLNELIKYIE